MNPNVERLQRLLDQELQDAMRQARSVDYRKVLLDQLNQPALEDSHWLAMELSLFLSAHRHRKPKPIKPQAPKEVRDCLTAAAEALIEGLEKATQRLPPDKLDELILASSKLLRDPARARNTALALHIEFGAGNPLAEVISTAQSLMDTVRACGLNSTVRADCSGMSLAAANQLGMVLETRHE